MRSVPMASASSHATMRAACSSRVTSARANARAAPTQPPASTSGRLMATAPAFFRRRVARARRVRAGADDSSRPLAEPFVTPEDVRRGEVARVWVSELYDCVDYAAVFAAAEEAAVLHDDDDAHIRDDDHSGERVYGEFDMGFFTALLRVLEPDLALLEYGDVDGGAVGDGVFVDVGSGRGQLAFLSSITRKWQRCVGLEIDKQLHAIATQVSLQSPNEDVVTDTLIDAFPVAARPMTQSPVSFVNGNMYDRNDLSAALENATLVFAFATRFKRDDERDEEGPFVEEEDSVQGDESCMYLRLSRHVRPHLRVGALVVIINGALRREDGFELIRVERGPDAERGRDSVARVYRVVEVRCDERGDVAGEKKKKKKTVS